MDMRKVGVGLGAVLAFGGVVWAVAGPSPATAQREGGQARSGRYQYVANFVTVVKIDTQTDKTYALLPPVVGGPLERDVGEMAWAPVPQFEDVEAYRRWLRERREAVLRER